MEVHADAGAESNGSNSHQDGEHAGARQVPPDVESSQGDVENLPRPPGATPPRAAGRQDRPLAGAGVGAAARRQTLSVSGQASLSGQTLSGSGQALPVSGQTMSFSGQALLLSGETLPSSGQEGGQMRPAAATEPPATPKSRSLNPKPKPLNSKP